MAYPYPPSPKKSNKKLLIVLATVLGVCLVCSGIAAGAGMTTMLFNNTPAHVADKPQATPTQPPAAVAKAPTPTAEEIVQPAQPTEKPASTTSALPASGIYTENFDTKAGAWPDVTTDNYKVGYSRVGNYFITILKPNASAYVLPPHRLQEPFTNVGISVNVRPGLEDGAYGIMCGFQDANNYYAVKVNQTQYSVYKVFQGKITFLTDPQWKPAVDIDKSDSNGYINLGVGCMGSTIVVQINSFGESIVMDDVNSFPTGRVALFASSGATQGNDGYKTVLFDDFSLQVKP